MKLNDFEKWYFDLKGYFVIKNAVSKKDINEMRQIANSWFDSSDNLPELIQKDFSQATAKFLYNFHYVEKSFENLVLNKKILRFINGIQKKIHVFMMLFLLNLLKRILKPNCTVVLREDFKTQTSNLLLLIMIYLQVL